MLNKRTLLATFWSILILIFCLINLSKISSTQNISFPHVDKVAHFIFYTAASFLWLWALINKKENRQRYKILGIILALMLFGFVIEILQDVLPTKRAFEWWDVAANVTGVFAGTIVFLLYQYRKPHQV